MSLKMLFLGNPVMVMDNQCSVLYDQKQCVQGSYAEFDAHQNYSSVSLLKQFISFKRNF